MSSRISVDHIRLKRAYEPPASDDGIRILIDRLWPRGVKKSDAAIDEWMKEIAPSTKLRKWFSHDPERWQEFRRRYQTENGIILTNSNGYVRLRNAVGSRWCSPRMTRRIPNCGLLVRDRETVRMPHIVFQLSPGISSNAGR